MNALVAALFSDKPYSASRNFIVSALVWLVVGVFMGFLASIQFSVPDALTGVAQLSFGRIRAVHINDILIGWLSMAYIGCFFYVIPNLSKREGLWSERLGNITLFAWNFILIWGTFGLLNGDSEAREYAELAGTIYLFGTSIQMIDWLVIAGILMMGINLWMTVATGREKHWYVSIWYILGSCFWFPILYIIGNRAFVALDGLNDAIAAWFYGHNILGMWFTVGGVGLLYYLIPRFTGNPLYSHTLSMIGFWTIAMFYAPTGTHHILQAPVPEWLKAVAVISSVFLLVPVFTVLTNFFMTLKGKWSLAADHIPMRFALVAGINYLLTCIQGPFQATRFINWYLHFSQWVVGHAHLALLGTFTFISFAGIYYILPRIVQRRMYSKRLAVWHFWLTVYGVILMMLSLTIAGLIQAAGWHHGIPVDQWVIELEPYWIIRSISGALILLGQILFMLNIYKTVFSPKDCEPLPHSPSGLLYV
jgi:cytochrome c oxidase cbb3-type subunit I